MLNYSKQIKRNGLKHQVTRELRQAVKVIQELDEEDEVKDKVAAAPVVPS